MNYVLVIVFKVYSNLLFIGLSFINCKKYYFNCVLWISVVFNECFRERFYRCL